MLSRFRLPMLRRGRTFGRVILVNRRHAAAERTIVDDSIALVYNSKDVMKESRDIVYGSKAEAEDSKTLVTDSKEIESWKREIGFKLGQKLKVEHRRYTIQKRRLADEHKVVCYIRDGRVNQLLMFINKLAKSLSKSEASEYGEIFSISLKYAADHLASNLENSEWLNSDKPATLIENFIHAMAYIPLCSNDVVLVNGYCLALVNRWKSLTSKDVADFESNIRIIDELQNRLGDFVKSWDVQHNRMLFNGNEFKIASKYFNFKKNQLNPSIANLSYEPHLRLGNDLFDICPEERYQGSPFVLNKLTKKQFVEKFREQIFNEQRLCFPIKNYARNSVEKPMERLLYDWRWDKAIASTFKQMIGKISSLTVRNYLNGLNGEDIADVLMECLIASLCQGKTLIPIQEMKFNLAHSILALSHRDFVKKSLNESGALLEKVCSEYFRYFCEPNLARQYNLREWWYMCATKWKVDPNFHVPFANFSSVSTSELADFLLDVIIQACKIPENKLQHKTQRNAFTFRNVNIEQLVVDKGNKSELVKMIDINSVLVDLIAEHQFEKLLFPYYTLPMTLPPRPWNDSGQCGPLYSRSSDVLRNLYEFPIINVNTEMKKRFRNNVQGRPVFDSLNDLGATPWIINKSTLNELIKAFDFTFNNDNKQLLKGLSVPMHSSTIRVPTVHEYFDCKNVSDIPSAEWFKFSKKENELTKERNESNSLWCWLMYRIVLANHFRDEVLYFPHNMDFRGRVYPISPHLNHMGDDINRCLLKFARGKPLGENGFDWLKIHCINLTGLMKKRSIADRLAFAEESIENILNSANDPWAENSWWLESEEPWQTLAACIEIRDVLKSGVDPKDYVSHLPVHQDGSCNGFQHYAALGRDKQGAMEVNLLPTDFPADIYSNVAVRVEKKRIEDETSEVDETREMALDLREHIKEPMPRKVIKQTVMTTIYGVTMFGAREQIKRQLKAIDIPGEKAVKFSTYIANKTLGSLNESFESSMKLKNWFRQCSRSIVKLMQPVEWETPLGLPVMQPYLKSEKKFDVLCHVPVPHKQVDAFPPNFVHSLDSTHMMLTTLYCRQRGVTFAAVHDCFWTHACDVEIMNEICRDQFIRLHNEPIVEDLGKLFQKVYLNGFEHMDKATLDAFRQSFTPSTKRGTLDLEEVRKSVYFFS